MRISLGCMLPAMLLCAATSAAAAPARCPAGDVPELVRAAELALARSEWPQATLRLACAAERSADPAVAERATRTAFEYQQAGKAVVGARRWLTLDPGSETARRHLAIALLRDYDDAAAAREFAPLLDGGDRGRAYGQLLGVLAEERNVTGAARIMDRLAAGDPDLPEARHAVSVLWQRADHGSRALAEAQAALALRPGWRLAQYAEMRALLTLGRRDEALARSAVLAAGDDAPARLSHAWMLAGLGQREAAAALFGELRREGPVAREALEALGLMAIDDRRYDDALLVFGELAREPRGAEGVAWHFGRIAEQRGDRLLALQHYQRAVTGPRAVAAQLRARRLWRELGLPERAELQIDEFLAATTGSTAEVVAGVASQLVEEGRAREAVQLLDRALRHLPDGDLLFTRALVNEKLGRLPAAIADLRALVARRPGNPDAANALGYTLVDHGQRLREGHELIERALAARPDSVAIQDSKGWALVRLGRVADGLPWLEGALERSGDPEVAAHLGEALWLLGREDEARAAWERARAEHPDSDPLRRAIERRLQP
jgi:tetratricopeptide (TPR) repeat protein